MKRKNYLGKEFNMKNNIKAKMEVDKLKNKPSKQESSGMESKITIMSMVKAVSMAKEVTARLWETNT
jgi:hypothetical protein